MFFKLKKKYSINKDKLKMTKKLTITHEECRNSCGVPKHDLVPMITTIAIIIVRKTMNQKQTNKHEPSSTMERSPMQKLTHTYFDIH